MLLQARPILFIAVVIILSVSTFYQNFLWLTEKDMWLGVMQKSLRKARPHTNIGILYDRDGKNVEAEREYKTAIRLEPDYLVPYSSLAILYGKRGEIDKAIEIFQWVLPQLPNKDPKVYTGLGVAYMIKGLLKEAETEFKEALKIDPNYATAHLNLAEVYERMGLKYDAMKSYQRFIETASSVEEEGRVEHVKMRLKQLTE